MVQAPAAAKRAAASGAKGAKKKSQSFVIDCTKPVEDSIMDIGQFEKFLLDRIKVEGKTGGCGVSAPEEAAEEQQTADKAKTRHDRGLSQRFIALSARVSAAILCS